MMFAGLMHQIAEFIYTNRIHNPGNWAVNLVKHGIWFACEKGLHHRNKNNPNNIARCPDLPFWRFLFWCGVLPLHTSAADVYGSWWPSPWSEQCQEDSSSGAKESHNWPSPWLFSITRVSIFPLSLSKACAACDLALFGDREAGFGSFMRIRVLYGCEFPTTLFPRWWLILSEQREFQTLRRRGTGRSGPLCLMVLSPGRSRHNPFEREGGKWALRREPDKQKCHSVWW